jgi:anti-anti-sigma regulatory factor
MFIGEISDYRSPSLKEELSMGARTNVIQLLAAAAVVAALAPVVIELAH